MALNHETIGMSIRLRAMIRLLTHTCSETTVKEVLPHAIKKLKDAGYRLVTVAECLGMEPYQSRWEPETPDVCPLFAYYPFRRSNPLRFTAFLDLLRKRTDSFQPIHHPLVMTRVSRTFCVRNTIIITVT